jgi:hypothetical protein
VLLDDGVRRMPKIFFPTKGLAEAVAVKTNAKTVIVS